MSSIEVSAKTLDEAIQKACIEFGVPSEQLNIEILEEGSKGMFGFFSKGARISASLKEEEAADVLGEIAKRVEKTEKKVTEKVEKAEKKVTEKVEKAGKKAAEKVEKAEKKVEETAAVAHEFITATGEKVVVDDSLEKRIREANARKNASAGKENKEKKAFEKAEKTAEPVAPVSYEIPADAEAVCEELKGFLKDVLGAMGLNVTVTAAFSEEGILEADIESAEPIAEGEDSGMGVIIGKRGNTLDSLQYLATLVLNKGRADHLHIKLDTEGYRKRRQETLENLAMGTARKVKKSGRRIVLDPMNPYERRIIHSALQNERGIETYSEGEEPYRKVVIAPVRGGYRK